MPVGPYDFCVYLYGGVDRDVSGMFRGTDYTYRKVPFRVQHEHFQRLAYKTYQMLQHLSASNCSAGLKVDDDATMCMQRIRVERDSLGMLYLGKAQRNLPLRYNANDRYWTPVATRVSRERRGVLYMQGASYIVGRDIARFITSKPWTSQFNTYSWEDYYVGNESSPMQGRKIVNVKWYSKRAGGCDNAKKYAIYHKCNRTIPCAL